MISLGGGRLLYVSTKPVRSIKMHLNETYNKIQTGKHLPDMCPIQNVWNKEMVLDNVYCKTHRRFWWENLNGRHCFIDLGAGERIVLKWILKKKGVDWIHLARP